MEMEVQTDEVFNKLASMAKKEDGVTETVLPRVDGAKVRRAT